MRYLSFLLPLVFLFVYSCSENRQSKTENKELIQLDSTYTVRYAKGFRVDMYDEGYKVVSVRNPWDTTKVLQKYILVDKDKPLPSKLPKGTIIRIPLSSVIVYSTIHSTTMNELGVIDVIKGVCESKYVSIPYVKEGIENGTIADLGQASNPMIEKIIEIDPQAIWATPVQGRSYGSISKAGIPVIETPDYMEATPLGRAEWIRFYSLFFKKEHLVDSLFKVTEKKYLEIKEQVSSVDERPTVFLDLMFRGVWYTSGGNSYISKMLSDAGATYVWHNNGKGTSTPMAFEQVLNDAANADFWLIKYNKPYELTYPKLVQEYRPYSYFDAYKNKNVFICNTSYQHYYEDLPIHPDYILQDFAYVFHPELFPDYKPRYYSDMKE